MIVCQNCTYKIYDDTTNYCPNCGYYLGLNLSLPKKNKNKLSNNQSQRRDWFIISLAVLVIIMMIGTVVIVVPSQPLIPAQSPLQRPILQSIHTITPIKEESNQNFDYFNNSIFFIQDNPKSIVKLTFNENRTDVSSITVNLLNYNLSISNYFSLIKFTTNGDNSFVLIGTQTKSLIYQVTGPTTNGYYILNSIPLNLTCEQPDIYSTSTTYCRFTDIKVIGENLYAVGWYASESTATIQGNILKEYNLNTNSVTKINQLPNQQSATIGVTETDIYLGINEGSAPNELLLNYENDISFGEGTLGASKYGFFTFNVTSETSKNSIQYTILSSTNTQLFLAHIKLSNMLYVNNSLLVFHYDDQSSQLVKFATYGLENVGSSNNVTIDV